MIILYWNMESPYPLSIGIWN